MYAHPPRRVHERIHQLIGIKTAALFGPAWRRAKWSHGSWARKIRNLETVKTCRFCETIFRTIRTRCRRRRRSPVHQQQHRNTFEIESAFFLHKSSYIRCSHKLYAFYSLLTILLYWMYFIKNKIKNYINQKLHI